MTKKGFFCTKMTMNQMDTTQKTLVIENPSPKLLDYVRGLGRKKEETQKELLSRKDKYFSPKI